MRGSLSAPLDSQHVAGGGVNTASREMEHEFTKGMDRERGTE